MTKGGDERIRLDCDTGLNRYLTAPRPFPGIAYSSSTANFVSGPAMAEVRRRFAERPLSTAMTGAEYARSLEAIRARLRRSWQLPATTEIIFAASGTDLEYVGLATALRADGCGIDNLLLGADEVGSGCIHSAAARHFAKETPLGREVGPGYPVDVALAAATRVVDIPVRENDGRALTSAEVVDHMTVAIVAAIRDRRQALIHIVHGSKTGLILPSLAHIDALRREFGDAISFVVDACQTRISREMVGAYLARGCTLFLTGSKFVGGPPFSGFALIPASIAQQAAPLPSGFARVFNRAEWPHQWPGLDRLPNLTNLGLLLRLEASLYEIERFHRLDHDQVERIIVQFEAAVAQLATRLDAVRVTFSDSEPQRYADYAPLELRTLATLDLSRLNGTICDHDYARRLYETLAQPDVDELGQPQLSIRLGQPVRCVRLADGRFGATIRISLSMPQIVAFAAMDDMLRARHLKADMACIADRIERFCRKGVVIAPV